MAALWDYICTSGINNGRGPGVAGGSGKVAGDPMGTIRLFENTWPLLPATGGVGTDAIRVLLEMYTGMPVVTPLVHGVAAGGFQPRLTDDIKKVGLLFVQ